MACRRRQSRSTIGLISFKCRVISGTQRRNLSVPNAQACQWSGSKAAARLEAIGSGRLSVMPDRPGHAGHCRFQRANPKQARVPVLPQAGDFPKVLRAHVCGNVTGVANGQVLDQKP